MRSINLQVLRNVAICGLVFKKKKRDEALCKVFAFIQPGSGLQPIKTHTVPSFRQCTTHQVLQWQLPWLYKLVWLTVNIGPNSKVVTSRNIEVWTSRETEGVDSWVVGDGRNVLHTTAVVLGHCKWYEWELMMKHSPRYCSRMWGGLVCMLIWTPYFLQWSETELHCCCCS